MNMFNRPEEGYTIGDGLYQLAEVISYCAIAWVIVELIRIKSA